MLFALRLVYTFFMLLAVPLLTVRLFWKSFNLRAYRERVLERFGIFPALNIQPGGFLIHAVSVGEVVLTFPLIKALQERYPGVSITVTTTTPTGSQRVQQSLGAKVAHVYMPFDLPWTIENLYQKVQPRCLIIMETEIWPHLIHMGKRHNIPVVIANGRISDQSIGRYLSVKYLIGLVLKEVTMVCAQSELDGSRFLQLGLPINNLEIAGNLKFDAQVNEQQLQIGKELKAALQDRIVWVAASTHPGEEEQILNAFKQVRAQCPNCLLILIPRHPDRFNAVAELLQSQQINFVRRSEQKACNADVAILLGDSMGEMGIYYAMADIAYVGGSLVPIGGHNLLEPAALSLPCITGPHYFNFKEIVSLLQRADALSLVQNEQELSQHVIELCGSPELRSQKGLQALQVFTENSGALQKLMTTINGATN